MIITFERSKPKPMKTFYQFRILTLATLFVCVLSTVVYAQTSRASFEVAGGPGYSFLPGSTSPPDKIGFQIGLFSNIRINNMVSIHTGISFDRKGSKYSSTHLYDFRNAEDDMLDLNYDYFTIPLVLRITFQKPFKFYINSGLYGACLHSNLLISNGLYEGYICYNNTPFAPAYDFGLVNGIGVLLPLHQQVELTVELRNNRGLSNIVGNPDYIFGGEARVRTNLTTLIVGISIRLGK